MKRKQFACLVGLVICLASGGEASAGEPYKTYFNTRYEYYVDYPASFVPQGEAMNRDGQVFLSPEKDAELRVYARICIDNVDDTPAHYLDGAKAEEKKGEHSLNYQAKGKDFAVISGYRKDKVFYNKVLTDGTWCTTMEFSYAKTQKAKYDAMVGRIANSLKRN